MVLGFLQLLWRSLAAFLWRPLPSAENVSFARGIWDCLEFTYVEDMLQDMQYKRCGSRFCESGQNNLKGYKSPCWCANARRYTLSPAHPPCRCPEDLKESDIVTGDCKYGAHAGTIPVSVKLKVVYINQELGLGVLANQDIEKGTLICEAVGELVSQKGFMVKLLDEPKLDQTYIMGTNTSANYAFVLDLTEKGNVARLFNHRCKGYNMRQALLCPDRTLGFHREGPARFAFFANRRIRKGTQLTYNYYQQLQPFSICYCACCRP